MNNAPIRRVVTGHDASGRAIIQEDGIVPRIQKIGGDTGP
ncbi:MAG TPA: cupin domain-containing protein, partial [Erythrobacter sp.]|nr:cupin domain-containing protein [Erythrobacter sp.]